MSKAILIIIDGCRPDGLMEAETPNIDGIIERGCHSFSAASVDPPTTLPVHISIFTSRNPVNHGVLTNAGVPDYSAGAWSIIDLVKYNGKSTSAFFSWEHFANLALPGAFDFFVHSHTVAQDELA
jgi:arylsulfatase A-like enzyme